MTAKGVRDMSASQAFGIIFIFYFYNIYLDYLHVWTPLPMTPAAIPMQKKGPNDLGK